MASPWTALTLSIVLLVAAIVFRSDGEAQTSAQLKNNHVVCGGSVLTGLANSGSKFTVKVFAFVSTDVYGMNHQERSVGSAKVILLTQGKMGHEISAVTDSRGIAEFSEVPSGTYTIHIEGARFWESQARLTVNAFDDTPTAVRLIWPQRAYSVRQVRGWLMDSNDGAGAIVWSMGEPNYKPRPFFAAQVQLIDLTSGSVLARTQTDKEGYYDFHSVGPGFYLVRFNENADASSPNFNMAVEVDDKAAEEHPPALKAEKHNCGSGLYLCSGLYLY